MATNVEGATPRETFWQRLALGLSAVIIFGFAQFALRGFADPIGAPPWVHLHGLAMLGWLALLVVQPSLVLQGRLDLHRRIGWIGAALALLITGLGIFTGVMALDLHRFPPFFTPPYFLALTVTESLVFGAMVLWAIRRRRATDWHRRLMIGATVIILEPALGRILPIPIMGGWAEPVVGLCQLGAVAIVAVHDRRTHGRIHPATWAVAGVVLVTRLAVSGLAAATPVVALAYRIVGT